MRDFAAADGKAMPAGQITCEIRPPLEPASMKAMIDLFQTETPPWPAGSRSRKRIQLP